MTKARDLAVFNAAGVLTSTSNLNATKLTSGTIPNARYGTPTFNGSNLTGIDAGGGKVLQVKVKHLPSSIALNGGGQTTALTSDTITLASSNNQLYVIASINYDLQGYSQTTDPAAQVFLYDQAGNALANQNLEIQLTNNTDGMEGVATLQAIYSPPDTSETVSIRYQRDNGQIRLRGSNNYHNATTLTVMEIAA